MISCPKCGFSQPKDKYCAQCGVDMESYAPPKTPFVKKLLFNPFFHLSTFIFILVFAVVYIQDRRAQELKERIEYLKGTQIESSAQTVPQKSQTSPATTTLNTNLNQNPAETSAEIKEQDYGTAEGSSLSARAANTDLAASDKPATGDDSASTTRSELIKIEVTYASVSITDLQDLIDASQSLSHTVVMGDFMGGSLSQIQNKLVGPDRLTRLTIYDKQEKSFSKDKPITWFTGAIEPETETELGLTTFISISELNNQLIRGELEIVRSLRDSTEPTSQATRRSFQYNFELPKDAGFFVAGVLPRRALSSAEIDFFNNTPLRLMNSPQFLNRETEFIMFFQISR